MKLTIIFISIVILTASCFSHSAKQRTIGSFSDSKRKEVSVAAQWFSQLQEYDSSHVVWQFRTAAPFTYHPDSGLRAQNGDLLIAMQSAHWRHLAQDSNSKATYVSDSQQRKEEQVTISERRPNSRKTAWWIAGILLLLGGLCIVSKYGVRT